MKTDFRVLMEKQLSEISGKPPIILHVCCAPCTTAVLELLSPYFTVKTFYYNPSIYPESEYEKRYAEFSKLESIAGYGDVTVKADWDHNKFLEIVRGLETEREGGERCRMCIADRMEAAARHASENGVGYFTTTLSVSPHKDAEFINLTGKKLAGKYNIVYLFADFKKKDGYANSVRISKKLEIYRQNYCGCEFSMVK